MKERCLSLYQSLLNDIKTLKGKFQCPKKEIEQCFIIGNQYWAIIRHDAANYEFENSEEEIFFFKELKPLFTAQVEFYSLFYHLHLFKSEVFDPARIKVFLSREVLRLEKFIAERRDFYDYYKAGRTDKDEVFFTRKKNNFNNQVVYELEARTVSSHDPLISSLLALERYNKYVRNELGNHNSGNE
ncbi:MAG: RteC domain-containing protein [Chitinophagaceae bacterium]